MQPVSLAAHARRRPNLYRQVAASPPAAAALPPPAAASCRSSPRRSSACAFAACTTSSSARLKWPSASLKEGATREPNQCSGREGCATSSYSASRSLPAPAALELGRGAAVLYGKWGKRQGSQADR